MLTEDFCSYEVTKLLKEKGFNELCSRLIREDGEYIEKQSQAWNGLTKKEKAEFYLCPTQQMACKWLREEKGIYICIIPRISTNTVTHEENVGFYINCARKVKFVEGITLLTEKEFCCPTYEEAIDSALKYCLENLI